MTGRQIEPGSFVECPACKGSKFLMVYDEARPDDPPQRVGCVHCHQNGFVSADQRSMNYDE